MLDASAALTEHVAQRCTTIATCWRVERRDGAIYGFTSLDTDILFEGVRYRAGTGISPSAISTQAGMAVDNLEAAGFLDSDAITEEDLRAGTWDHAELRVFQVNWRDLSQGALRLRRGWLGEVTIKDTQYAAEVRGMTSALNATIAEIVGPSCTAELGDVRCRADLADYTASGTVTSVSSDRTFDTDLPGATVRLTPSTTGNPPASYFSLGILTWTTGVNVGRTMDVRTYTITGEIGLQLPMAQGVEPGDDFTVVAGCDKSRALCGSRWGNVLNFRGFPDLPGTDKILRVGGQ